MDEVLTRKFKELEPTGVKGTHDTGITVQSIDDATIEIGLGDRKETYLLRPLGELFGEGTGVSFNPQDEVFLPLLLSIEETIINYDTDHRLKDSAVALALDPLSMDPAAASTDPLVLRLQSALRLVLSLNNYSRQEVRQAIRKVAKSVHRHENGDRGYLNFIREMLRVDR